MHSYVQYAAYLTKDSFVEINVKPCLQIYTLAEIMNCAKLNQI